MKVVINRCFGGFSLSPRGIKAYADRKGWPCFFFVHPKGDYKSYERITDDEAFGRVEFFGPTAFKTATPPQGSSYNWHEMSLEEREASNREWSESSIYDRDIPRDDPDLIAVVEALGELADGRAAKLCVVEIPDDVEWEIDEYDGSEQVAEKHRTWG